MFHYLQEKFLVGVESHSVADLSCFLGGPTIFAPSDIVVQGLFQVVSVILAPYKINLCSY